MRTTTLWTLLLTALTECRVFHVAALPADILVAVTVSCSCTHPLPVSRLNAVVPTATTKAFKEIVELKLRQLPDVVPIANTRQLPDVVPIANTRQLPDALPIANTRQLPDALPIANTRQLPDALPIANTRQLPDALPIANTRQLPDALPIANTRQLPDALPIANTRPTSIANTPTPIANTPTFIANTPTSIADTRPTSIANTRPTSTVATQTAVNSAIPPVPAAPTIPAEVPSTHTTPPPDPSERVTVQWVETWPVTTSRTWVPKTITVKFGHAQTPAAEPGKGSIGMGTLKGDVGKTRTVVMGAAATKGPEWYMGGVVAAGVGLLGMIT